MKINSIQNYQKNNFRGGLNNKLLLKTLEFTSENNALVSAGLTLGMSTLVRPFAIMHAPKTEKEEKKIQAAKSIASGLIGFGFTAAIFTPISAALDNISKNPDKFLKKSTVENLKNGSKSLVKSKPFNFLKQTLKFSPEFMSVIPKTILTCALIVPVTKLIFDRKNENKKIDYNYNSQGFDQKSNLTFKSNLKLPAKAISKIMNNETIQKIAVKGQNTNFMQHATVLKDIFATACFALAANLTPSIDKDKKKSLAYNAAIATGLTIAGGYAAEKAIRKPVQNFTKAFVTANKNDKNLFKYLNGIKTLEPLLILSSLYYIGIPVISTFLSGKLNDKTKNDTVNK